MSFQAFTEKLVANASRNRRLFAKMRQGVLPVASHHKMPNTPSERPAYSLTFG